MDRSKQNYFIKKVLFGIVFWILSLSWGLLMTTFGLIAGLFCLIFLKGKPHRNGCSFIIEVGKNWGGLSLGAITFCSSYYNIAYFDLTRKHEFGHSIQNLYLGLLFPLFVGIPSASRYWLTTIKNNQNRVIFTAVLAFILLTLPSIVLILGVSFKIAWLIYTSCFFIIYAICFNAWLINEEYPKYKENTPDYYAFWAESNASNIGAKFVDWLEF